jgi:hypothetical protein
MQCGWCVWKATCVNERQAWCMFMAPPVRACVSVAGHVHSACCWPPPPAHAASPAGETQTGGRAPGSAHPGPCAPAHACAASRERARCGEVWRGVARRSAGSVRLPAMRTRTRVRTATKPPAAAPPSIAPPKDPPPPRRPTHTHAHTPTRPRTRAHMTDTRRAHLCMWPRPRSACRAMCLSAAAGMMPMLLWRPYHRIPNSLTTCDAARSSSSGSSSMAGARAGWVRARAAAAHRPTQPAPSHASKRLSRRRGPPHTAPPPPPPHTHPNTTTPPPLHPPHPIAAHQCERCAWRLHHEHGVAPSGAALLKRVQQLCDVRVRAQAGMQRRLAHTLRVAGSVRVDRDLRVAPAARGGGKRPAGAAPASGRCGGQRSAPGAARWQSKRARQKTHYKTHHASAPRTLSSTRVPVATSCACHVL